MTLDTFDLEPILEILNTRSVPKLAAHINNS